MLQVLATILSLQIPLPRQLLDHSRRRFVEATLLSIEISLLHLHLSLEKQGYPEVLRRASNGR